MNEEKVPEAGKEPIERSYQPATQDPNALLNDAPVTEGASAEERTEALFTRLHSSRRFLNGILEFCCEERTEDEVAGEVARMRALEFCIYGADVLCAHLVEAGALERIEPERDDVRVVGSTACSTWNLPVKTKSLWLVARRASPGLRRCA